MNSKFIPQYSPKHQQISRIKQQRFLQLDQDPLYFDNVNSVKKYNSPSSDKQRQLKQLLESKKQHSGFDSSRFVSENNNEIIRKIQEMCQLNQKLRMLLLQKEQNINVLQQHNSNIMMQIRRIQKKMQNTIYLYQEQLRQNQQMIETMEEQIMIKQKRIKQVVQEYNRKQQQFRYRIQSLKNTTNQDYNELLSIKQRQILNLQQKINLYKQTRHILRQDDDIIIQQLTKQQKSNEQKIKQLQHYITSKQQIIKKMSHNHDKLVLQNQVLRQNKLQLNFGHTNTKNNKQLQDIKSKYDLLTQMNRKLQIQLQTILVQTQQYRKRQTILQMQIQQLQSQIRQLKSHRWNDRSVGKIINKRLSSTNNLNKSNTILNNNNISSPKSITKKPQQKFKINQYKVKQLLQKIKQLQTINHKIIKIDQIIIKQLRDKIQNTIKLNRFQAKQNLLYELLTMLDKIPFIKSTCLRDSCQSYDIFNIFQIQQSRIIRRDYDNGQHPLQNSQQRSHKSYNVNAVKAKRLNLQIQVQEDQNLGIQLCHQIFQTGNQTGHTQIDSVKYYEQV